MRSSLPLIVVICLGFSASCFLRSKGSADAVGGSTGIQGSGDQGSDPVEHGSTARYLSAGYEAYLNDRDQDAVEAYNHALDLDPDCSEAYYKLGLAFASLGRRREAFDAYKKAVDSYKKETEHDPQNSDAHFNMAEAESKLGKYDDAVAEYKKALQFKKDDGYLYYELGLADNKTARYKDAVDAFQQALRIDANDFRAAEALEKARQDLNRQKTMVDRAKAKMLNSQEVENANGSQNSQPGKQSSQEKNFPVNRPARGPEASH